MKRTFQPSNRKRVNKHGFRARMATKSGRMVIKNRRAKGRKRLSVSDKQKFPLPKRTLPKHIILKKNEDFDRIFQNGQAIHKDDVSAFFVNAAETKVGFSVSKKVRTKPQRNRIKRRLRELWRLNWQEFRLAHHIVFLGKPAVLKATFANLEKEFCSLLKEIEQSTIHY